jgi:hypothetical protein
VVCQVDGLRGGFGIALSLVVFDLEEEGGSVLY